MTDIQKPQDLPRDEGIEWLSMLVADNDGVPRRVMGIGTTVLLDNGDHVAVGLIRNGHRQAWKPA